MEKKNKIALIYDFDKTLSDGSMQEQTILSYLGIEPTLFWEKTSEEAKKMKTDIFFTYMRLLLKESKLRGKPLTKELFVKWGQQIDYYNGVKKWFDMTNEYVSKKSRGRISLRHYLISSGNYEILENMNIASSFRKIYASHFVFNSKGEAIDSSFIMTASEKTQCLFRINKGIEGFNKSVHRYMEKSERPIDFSSMIYVGDGETDIPSMSIVITRGGNAIAVYTPNHDIARKVGEKLFYENRVDFVVKADYSRSAPLYNKMKCILDMIMSRMFFLEEVCKQRRKLEE